MKQSWDIEQEPDRVATRRLLLISGVGFVVGLACVFTAAQMRNHSDARADARPPVPATEVRPSPLEQSPIEHAARGLELRAEQNKRLGEYGWVDRSAGVVRIPIERAMELRVQEQR